MAARTDLRSKTGIFAVALVGALLVGLWLGSVLEREPKLPFFMIGGLGFLLVLGRRPRLVLSCLIPVLALEVGVTGTLTLKVAIAGAVGLVWIVGLVTSRWRVNLVGHGLLAAVALLLAASLYTSGGSDFPSRQSDWYGLAAGIVLCAAAMSIGLIPIVLLRTTAYGIGLIALAYEVGALGETDTTVWGSRASALGLNPNYLGVVFASGLIASVALLSRRGRGREAPIALVSGSFCTAVLFATQSRGALVVAATGVAVILVSVVRSRAIVGALIGGLVIVVLVTPTARTDIRDAALGDRDTTDFTVSDTLRGEAVSLALRYTTAHPLDGIGYGLFPTRSVQDGDRHLVLNTHNDYLRLSTEAGIPALLAFLLLLLPAFRRRNLRALDVGLRALLLAQVVSLVTGNYLSNLQVSGPLWLILGFLWWRTRPAVADEAGSTDELVTHTSRSAAPRHDGPRTSDATART